jgi:hypothetical protein
VTVLAGCDDKLRRADEHYDAMDDEIGGFHKAKLHSLVREVEKDGLEHVAYLRMPNPPDIAHWGLLLGDFVHNLRSALDHAVYELAARGSGQDPPPTHNLLQFPIADDETKWEKALGRSQLLGVPAAAVDVIHAAQPYKRGDDLAVEPLVLIRDNDVADKHRFVVPTLMNAAAMAIDGFNENVRPVSASAPATIRPIDGYEIARVVLAEPNVEADLNFKLKLVVTLRHAPNKEGIELSGLDPRLREMRAEVGRIIEELRPIAAMHEQPPPPKMGPPTMDWSYLPTGEVDWPTPPAV